MAGPSREISSAMDENHDELRDSLKMLAGLIAPRLRLRFVSATPWLQYPASIVARHVITLIMRLGT